MGSDWAEAVAVGHLTLGMIVTATGPNWMRDSSLLASTAENEVTVSIFPIVFAH